MAQHREFSDFQRADSPNNVLLTDAFVLTGEGSDVPTPAILTKELTRIYGAQTAVDHVDLVAPAGAVYGVLGPMGAGKTTLVRLLLGLIPPTSGSAHLLGYDVQTNADAIRARTGVVLQSPGVYENLSALENLELYARIWHLPAADRAARIRELLQHLNLWSRRNERVCAWSPGMKHKLAILRALVHRPALLILDEPTAGLDVTDQSILRSDLAMLAHQEGTTVLITTRDPGEAAVLCDQIAVLYRGRIVAQGSPKGLVQRDDVLHIMIQGAGFTEDLVHLVGCRRDVMNATVDNGSLFVDVASETACAAIVNLIVESGADVQTVERRNGGLETAYQSILEQCHETELAV